MQWAPSKTSTPICLSAKVFSNVLQVFLVNVCFAVFAVHLVVSIHYQSLGIEHRAMFDWYL